MNINKIYNEDCISKNGMCILPNELVDLILCDLPYNSTACAWDSPIPLEPLWEQYKRIIKPNGTIVLFASNPFSSILTSSNLPMYRYEWIWDKTRGSNFQQANFQPMRQHEHILVFSHSNAVFSNKKPTMRYYPQKTDTHIKHKSGIPTKTEVLHDNNWKPLQKEHNGFFPKTILTFPKDDKERKKQDFKLHKTTKPIKLLEYLILTYTNKYDIVLDSAIGCGSTAIAAFNLERNFIGFEKNEKIYSDCIFNLEKVGIK